MKRLLPWIVFAAILIMLIVVEARPAFPDPDSFYHAKMALMIRDQGFVHEFPWLRETVLAEHYVDHHLLYHILLIPFVSFATPLVGMKISAVVFALLAFYVLYRVLKEVKAPRPEWLTLAAALSVSFFHRMSLPRAPSLSVAFLFLGVWAMLRRKHSLTFIIAALFVWLYNGWPLLIAAFLCVALAEVLAGHLLKEKMFTIVKTGAALLAGLVAGLVINPYFPTNIQFDILHIVKIGLANYAPNVPVGQEWGGANLPRLVSQNILTVLPLVLSICLLIPAAAARPVRLTRDHIAAVFTFTLMTAGFFLMTLKSTRYSEYLIPVMVLATGSVLAIIWPFIKEELYPEFRRWFAPRVLRAGLALGTAMAVFFLFVVNTVQTAIPSGSFQRTHYEGATNWLRANVPPGAIIFHNTWDSSMVLFYLDDTHYYLIGLDPRFMYDKSPERYQVWEDIVSGKGELNKIDSAFGSQVVFIDKRIESSLRNQLEEGGFQKQYADEWTEVYTLTTKNNSIDDI